MSRFRVLTSKLTGRGRGLSPHVPTILTIEAASESPATAGPTLAAGSITVAL